MTVYKIFTTKPLVKGDFYRKAELVSDVGGNERMASSYFDPTRSVLLSFYDKDNTTWINNWNKKTRVFSFHHVTRTTLDDPPAWENDRKRHVFYHHCDLEKAEYEYLGEAGDYERVSVNGRDEIQFTVH